MAGALEFCNHAAVGTQSTRMAELEVDPAPSCTNISSNPPHTIRLRPVLEISRRDGTRAYAFSIFRKLGRSHEPLSQKR